MTNRNTVLFSAVGLIVLLLALIAFNYLASTVALRADLTAGKLYTLSEGTRRILGRLDTPVKLRLYVSQGEAMPVPMRSFSKRVEDMVDEFRSAAEGKLIVERYNPKPDSDEEDAAQLDGVEPQQLASGDVFYLGIAVTQIDRKQAIPSVSPRREQLLEYDLARAIARVGSASRPKVGVMAGPPVLGASFNPMTRQPAEPWVLAAELKRDFDVAQIPLGVAEIPKDIDVLLLIHPRNIQPQAEYALDQFILRGGKLIAFVDPYAYFDAQPGIPGMPPIGTSSSLPTLFKAWGVTLPDNKLVADMEYRSGAGQRETPTVLTLNRTAFNRDDVVTSQIESVLYPWGGAFEVKPAEGLKVQPLIRSSGNSMLVDSAKATTSGDEAFKGFLPDGQAKLLALRLSGVFKSAFADGPPPAPEAKDKKPAPAVVGPHRAKADKENAVLLVADMDLLADPAAVDVQELFGQKIIVPSNGNLALALGMVEQFASGDELISLRSRAAAFRPLTVVRALEAEAAKQYFGKISALEQDLQKTSEKLQALQGAKGSGSGQILTAEQQTELERFRKSVAQTRKELKAVRKNLRKDSEALAFWTKVLNIAVPPLALACIGLGVALLRRRRAQRSLAAGGAQ
ncbi:MAG TPA: GldG family protein [Burkholderiales bacterium]|nr:GldG family protein [Burkholderiales bacterium]